MAYHPAMDTSLRILLLALLVPVAVLGLSMGAATSDEAAAISWDHDSYAGLSEAAAELTPGLPPIGRAEDPAVECRVEVTRSSGVDGELDPTAGAW